MDKTRVRADWPPLTLPEVRLMLAKFPECGIAETILSVSPRPFSAASVVSTSNRCVFIKRHHQSVRDREGLREEHSFLQHLHAHGAPVPRVFADSNGETAIESGAWIYEAHEVPDAVDIYEDALSWTPFRSAAHARSAGETLARLHLAVEGFDAPRRKAQPLVASFTIFAEENPRIAMDRYVAERPTLAENSAVRKCCDEALELLAPFHAQLRTHLPTLEPLWTHNDLHASNLLWSDASDDARAVAAIDFGLADRTNAVYDLAHAIERNFIGWLDLRAGTEDKQDIPMHIDQLLALLDGYNSVRPLSEDEAAALAPMVTLCHAEFALTEADYFLGVLQSEEKARVACENYLVGHARWFRSTGGTRLLDAIVHWAEMRELQSNGVERE
jgi:Ser/Thr protein kinase RdoA (MazF antagonist)